MKKVSFLFLLAVASCAALGQLSGLPAPPIYEVATGAANTYVVTQQSATLTYGQVVIFLPNAANTSTAPSLNLNGLGAIQITRNGQYALVAGDLASTAMAVVYYDGTYWELVNPQTIVTFGTGSSLITMLGAASGFVKLTVPSAAGSAVDSFGSNSGTPVVTATAPLAINAATGNETISLFPVNAQTATYQVLAADFASCKTITTASGTFTVTLVASSSQPASGQCVWVVNYGTGVITIARSGQNLNGGTTSLTVAAGSATAPTGAWVVSDGTNYEATLFGASSGGGLPTGTAGQTIYYATGGTTGTATNAMTFGGTTALTPSGLGGIELNATVYEDTYQAAGSVVFNGSCASGTTTNCAITGGAGLDPNGGYVWGDLGDTFSSGEWIKYCSATSTTITFCSSGRGIWGSSAQTHANGANVVMITYALISSATTAPYKLVTSNGFVFEGGISATQNGGVGSTGGASLVAGNALYGLGGVALSKLLAPRDMLGYNPSGISNGQASITNDSANATVDLSGNALDYSIAVQSVTGTSLTAITNAQTPVKSVDLTPAAAAAGGVLSSHCEIIWNQATAGTVEFGVKASAAPADLWVSETDNYGVQNDTGAATKSYFNYTTITGTTTTLTSQATITPDEYGFTYHSVIDLKMNPGTSNNVQVQLYALTSSGSDTLTIEPGTGCGQWN